jgi:hypothetical protein
MKICKRMARPTVVIAGAAEAEFEFDAIQQIVGRERRERETHTRSLALPVLTYWSGDG